MKQRIVLSVAAVTIAVSLNVEAMGPDSGGQAKVNLTTSQLQRLIVRIANREITKRARGLRVGSADRSDRATSAATAGVAASATNAVTAQNALTAQNANTSTSAVTARNADHAAAANVATNATFAASANFAASAQPAIFAKIKKDGTLDPALSKGFTAANIIPSEGPVTRRTGLLCFKGIPGMKGASVTTEPPTDPGDVATSTFTMGVAGDNGAGPGCPDDAEFGIQTLGCEDDRDDDGFPVGCGVFMVIYQ